MRRLPFLVACLALLHLCLALGFAWVTPWRTPGVLFGHHTLDIGAPDEYAHANYVRHLLRGDGLPKLDPQRAPAEATYEDHQPPLFYLLDAGAGKIFGVGVDDPAAKMPLRGVNALVGAATVVGTFLLVLWASDRPRLALGASAFVAILPMNLALSGAVSNDPLLYALATFAFAVGVRHLRAPTLPSAVLLGLLIGLAVLTKFTALLLLLMVPFFVKERRHLAIAWGVALLVAAPYLVRNEIVYGHPLAAGAFKATFERTVDPASLRSPRGLFRWVHTVGAGTALSGVGQFGYMDVALPTWITYPLLALLAFGIGQGFRLPSAPKRFRNGAWTFSILLLLSYASYNLFQIQPQSRYLFPAIGLIAYACVEGYRRRGGPSAFAVLLAGLLVADGIALTILPGRFADHTDPPSVASGPPTSR